MPDHCPGTVLITGAARRVGRAIALDLAAHGWRVAIHCHRSRPAADILAREITGQGGEAAVFEADLADLDATRALVPHCAAHFGAPGCLINNASLFDDDSLMTMTADSWQAHLDINLRAPAFLGQAFAAALPPECQGNIINLIDQRVWRPTPLFFSYSASKAALWAITRTMAQALAPRIRVNAIGPGPVLQSIHQTTELFEQERRATLLGRGASPQDIAAAVRFILDTPAITGQMIALDGGQHLAWRP